MPVTWSRSSVRVYRVLHCVLAAPHVSAQTSSAVDSAVTVHSRLQSAPTSTASAVIWIVAILVMPRSVSHLSIIQQFTYACI